MYINSFTTAELAAELHEQLCCGMRINDINKF